MKVALNLLPPVYRRQRLVRRRTIEWTMVLFVALSAVCIARWYKVHEYRVLKQQLDAVSRGGYPAQAMLREIIAMRAKIQKLDHYQTIAQELEQQRHVLALLGAVSQAAEQTQGRLRVTECRVVDLQATEVAQNRGNDATQVGTVTLSGLSLDSPTVAEFNEGLKRSGLFADVKLIKSQERNQPGSVLYEYEVRCEL